MATVLTIVTGASVAAWGCAGAGPGTRPAGEERVLRTNLQADPAMVDPITYSELIAGDVLDDIYESFTTIDENGRVEPALATRWEPHEDYRGFRFHLRQGVRFHSGREFTAADVKWSLEQLLIPGNRGGLNAKYAARIQGAQAVIAGETTDLAGAVPIDDHTVDIRFEAVEVLFPLYPVFLMDRGIVEEHGPGWASTVSAGTGPFKFVEWRRGQRIRLSAHEAYWGDGPHLDGVDFLVVPSDLTAISMYEAGELDVVFVDVRAGRRIMRDERFASQRHLVPSSQINFLGMNRRLYEPFDDIRLREAICLVLDREAMVEGLYSGAGVPLYGQITPGVAGFNAALPPIRYDPDRARALLVDAGHPEGAGLPPVTLSGTEPNRMLLAYIASQLESVLGMSVEVEVVERGIHIAAMNAGQVAFFPWGWSAGYPDAMYFLGDVWYGPSPYNRSRWQHDGFDRLIEQAQQTPDDHARYALYHEAEQVLLDDWGTCPLTVPMHIALVKPGVSGVRLTPFRFLPFSSVDVE